MLKTRNSRSFALALALSAAVVCFGTAVSAYQQMDKKMPTMTASLIDPEMSAKDKSATVEVKVSGAKLIDPAMSNKKPTVGEGHLHYQVDDGPVIATTTPKLSFHGLTSGKHKIVVMLANNDHSPAGPQQTLEITVP